MKNKSLIKLVTLYLVYSINKTIFCKERKIANKAGSFCVSRIFARQNNLQGLCNTLSRDEEKLGKCKLKKICKKLKLKRKYKIRKHLQKICTY